MVYGVVFNLGGRSDQGEEPDLIGRELNSCSKVSLVYVLGLLSP
jgi:hypothetical protein